ncbi:xanthine dehydrogenase accessory protein XdhC [Sneathiella aquimaris]|uniref:xanthine dehydrogenase accessory protein XdhC n=1 Tax=Sneathiella aquimaris TaxID=2599305 RepID=UPI00146F2A1B|nr:xanthine dehydrogenase accessory protein XdhC [Sneathiella aquimaris]
MMNWSEILRLHKKADEHSVLLTVAATQGSTPRETGASMLVTNDSVHGTIGGGELEYRAIAKAKEVLCSEKPMAQLLDMPLGPELAQCCGGTVRLLVSPLQRSDQIWMEALCQNMDNKVLVTNWADRSLTRDVVTYTAGTQMPHAALIEQCLTEHRSKIVTADDEAFTLIEPASPFRFHLTLFGAGHVGKAIVNALSPLPCKIDWVDERAEMFTSNLPANVKPIVVNDPSTAVLDMPKNGHCLILTHSHQQDLEICAKVLKRTDAGFVGLIGSDTKRAKFERRLKLRGVDEASLLALVCPIGITDLRGKAPAEIAISVCAELLIYQQKMEDKNMGTSNERKTLFGSKSRKG